MSWGLIGISWLLLGAILRLWKIALDMLSMPLEVHHWIACITMVLFMAYSEGYRGFQQGFAPRFAARLRYLFDNPRPLHLLLAPLFCMGFYYSTRTRIITTFSLTIAIILLIVAVQYLPQPWRGILDLGVVAGLSWGFIAVVYFSVIALRGDKFNHSAELPESNRSGITDVLAND